PSTVGGESIPATNAEFTLTRLAGGQRSLILESDIADATVTGTWSFETLVNSAARGVDALASFVSRTSRYQPEPLARSSTTIAQPIDAHYELNLKDLSRLSGFIKGADLAATGKISGDIAGNANMLDISAVGTLDQLRYSQGSTNVRLGAAQLNVNLKGITPYGITNATSATITLRSDSLLHFGDMTFTIPSMAVELRNGMIDVRGATVINREISILVDGQIDASNPAGYLFRLDTMIVNLPQQMYSWRNVGVVQAVVADDFVRIDSLTIQRANAEIIGLKGTLAGNRLDSIEISIVRATLADITSLLQSPDDMYGGRDIGGKINDGIIKLNGTLDNPTIAGHIGIDSVIYSGSRVGNFAFDFAYSDSNAAGDIILSEVAIGRDSMELPARITIRSLPIDLALASRENRMIPGKPVDITVTAKELPVALIAPFVPGVRLQRGTADLDFTIGGTLPNADYHGSVQLNNIWATIEANNVLYRINGRATFRDNVLAIEKMFMHNDPRELVESGAEVSGKVVFNGLEPDELDITVVARKLLVLSEASEAVDLGVYGDVVVRTGTDPLELTGTLTNPRLRGDVVILSGDLRIPDSESRMSSEEVVTFINYDEWTRLTQTSYGPELPPNLPRMLDTTAVPGSADQIDSTVRESSLQQAAIDMRQFLDSARARSAAPSPSFADALSADLDISMDRPMGIRMDMGPFEQLRLFVRQAGRNVRFVMRPGEDPQLWGNFTIEDGSEYTYIKRFEATGEVAFKGDITNPAFSVNARYDGRRYSDNGTSQEFQVTVAIQGTSERLKRPEFNYTIAGQSSATDAETRFRNAISLLLFSRTADELRATGVGSHVGALASSALSSGGSTVASTALSDAFAGSFVRSFDV
ncbi:MAG: translocation/assembly module TamB domain-containing protein, partial [bacterium]|nr:translocation/assembly module TamB domain-containing protein [Candidatus Kapabacteria bacterium]